MSDVKWFAKGYRRCSVCGSLVDKNTLEKGVCASCNSHKCVFCNSGWNVSFCKVNNYGYVWVCKWHKRNEDVIL